MEGRVIKFRAWNGKYMIDSAFGDFVSFDGVTYTEPDQRGNTPHTEITRAKDYVLMQFTGLKDKNGVDIYEFHEINNEFRVVFKFNRYILQHISSGDIMEFLENGQYEITREYCPIP